MNHGHAFPVLLTMALISGCCTHPPTQKVQRNAPPLPRLLSASEPGLGRAYDLEVYVIQKGDTVALICKRFQISVLDFMDRNPELDPTRLRIGQQVRIRESIKD